jgi:hypothetical protein
LRKLATYLGIAPRALAALIVVFLCTLPAVTPRIYASDEVQYFSYLRSLWFDHDVSFENEYRYFYDNGIVRNPGFHETYLERTEPTGRRINFATMGCAILWAPFYAVADAGVRIARLAGANVEANGMTKPYIAAVAYGSAFYGFLAVLLSIGIANRLIGSGLWAGVIVWLGTPLIFYMYVTPPMSHACSAFTVALFLTIWLHAMESWPMRWTIALGASAALMTMVREQDVFFVIGPVCDFMLILVTTWRYRRRIGPMIAAGAAGALTFVLCYAPQLLAYHALNGRFGPSQLVGRKMSWTSPHRIEVLFSTEHGFFLWTPLALVAIVGIAYAMWRDREWRHGDADYILTLMLIMTLAQVYISGAVESWTVAGAFGQRRFVGLTAILVVGIAIWLEFARARPARYALGAIATLGIYWNIALMAQFGTGMMDRQRLELRRNAYNAFVVLPRTAPELVSRYLTRRDTFYRAPERTP